MMNACVRELNDVISNMDEKLVYMIIDYAKEIQSKKKCTRKLGIADGKYNVPDDIDFCNEEVATMFGV